MKAKEVAKRYSLEYPRFELWLKKSGIPYRTGALGGLDVDDAQDVDAMVEQFQIYDAGQQETARLAAVEHQRIVAERELESQRKAQALSKMLITSGFSFHGYVITKYSGYISGDDAVQIERGKQGLFGGGVTDVGSSLMESLKQIRRNALKELKEAAYDLGCNAVIGVDFDYLTLDPETVSSQGGTLYLPYVFGVTANGNAVIIEKSRHTAAEEYR